MVCATHCAGDWLVLWQRRGVAEGCARRRVVARLKGRSRIGRMRAHPWRYARYYVKNAKSGELSEAVVAAGKELDRRCRVVRRQRRSRWISRIFSFEPEVGHDSRGRFGEVHEQ